EGKSIDAERSKNSKSRKGKSALEEKNDKISDECESEEAGGESSPISDETFMDEEESSWWEMNNSPLPKYPSVEIDWDSL
ncbi:hypothetical protein M569_14449, partial [Genlisea aurea]